MSREFRVPNSAESYTFDQYFELPFVREEILADLGCTLIRGNLDLPTSADLEFLPRLSEELERNLAIVRAYAPRRGEFALERLFSKMVQFSW